MIDPQKLPELAADFGEAYYALGFQTWKNTRFKGFTLYKYPTDLWVYQEIIHETRPTVVIETGTAHGGSALYFAWLGVRVITVDINRLPNVPQHDRIEYVTGSSVDPAVVQRVRTHLRPDDRVMVILDSDHAEPHVTRELAIYPTLVTPGCYLIVEDTNVNGYPAFSDHGPGPMEAVMKWRGGGGMFERDPGREKFMLTTNPAGYWRRT